MSDFFLDLRGSMIRAITAEGNMLKYAGMFGPFAQFRESIVPTMKRIAEESGIKVGAVHVILPYEEVQVQMFRIQKMEYQDAVKVARRKIVSETGIKEPAFFLTYLRSEGAQQVYLAEILRAGCAAEYRDIFSSQKIRVKTLTTAFQAGLKVFGLTQEPGAETRAVFDIDRDLIEAVVYHHRRPVYYLRHPFGPVEGEKNEAAVPQERIEKMKLYRIIDSIYKINLLYHETRPDFPFRKLWLCGIHGGIEGITEALNDTMHIDVARENPYKEAGKETYAYAALAGIQPGLADGTLANFILQERDWLSGCPGRIMLGVSAALYGLFLISWIYIAESRHTRTTNELALVTSELKAQGVRHKSSVEEMTQVKTLWMIEQKQKRLYGIMRHLANAVPEDVYLEKILFRQLGEQSIVELEFVTPYDIDLGTKQVLTRIDGVVSSQRFLKRRGESAVSVGMKGPDKVVRVKMVCEVKDS